MSTAQFLGAFNDNVTKQLAMLVCLRETSEDRQAWATLVFAIPFLLFSGTAGYFADRVSKTWIVQACKIAEVAIQGVGLALAFVVGAVGGSLTLALLFVLFLMGAHSAFFGPAKYGVLPEMLSKDDLPKANGIFIATTFLAIIFGWVVAGGLLDMAAGPLHRGVLVACAAGVGFAVVGWIASCYLRPTPPAQPDLTFSKRHLAVDPATWRIIGRDRLLLGVLTINGTFFLCGGVMHPAVNAFGVQQLATSNAGASGLLSCVAWGIALGCLIAGKWCGARADLRVSKVGAGVIVASLLLLSLTPRTETPSTAWLSVSGVLLGGIGVGAGLLAVPLQVVLQTRPPIEHKGRILAALSCFNWVGVLISAGFYKACLLVRESMAWPPSVVFTAVAAVMAAVAIFLPARVVESDESLNYRQPTP
jgi:MFS family permease